MNQLKLMKYNTAIVFLLSFAFRYFEIFSVTYSNGWDGCFYEMQMHTRLKTGQMHSPNYSLIYLLLKPLAWLSSPRYSYKILAAITSALFSTLIYVFAKKKTDIIAGLAVFVLSLASPVVLFVSHQFTKNLLGLDIILLYLIIEKRKRPLSLLLLLLAFITHRVAFAIMLIYGIKIFTVAKF